MTASCSASASSNNTAVAPSPTSLSAPAVSRELVDALRQLLLQPGAGDLTAICTAWKPVTALYHALPVSLRREHVRPHRSLAQVLQKLRSTLSIELDSAALHYRLCADDKDAGLASSSHAHDASEDRYSSHGNDDQSHSEQSSKRSATAHSSEPLLFSPSVLGHAKAAHATAKVGNKHADRSTTSCGNHTTSANNSSASSSNAVSSMIATCAAPPVDFYYRVILHNIPPPPPDFDVTPSALRGAQVSEDGAIVALADLVPYIPPFFVPMREVLSHMPGYTEEHLQRYLLGTSMEAVEVRGVRYVRLHGGMDMIRLDGCDEAERTFARYRANVELLPHFVAAFAGCVNTWVPLRLLLSRVRADVVAQLPFDGHAAIIYFAQMQHVFAFSLDPACVAAPSTAPCGFADHSMRGDNNNSSSGGSDCADGNVAMNTCDTEAVATSTRNSNNDTHNSPMFDSIRDTTAVLLRSPGYCGLDVHTTPVPKSCNYMLGIVAAEATVDVQHIEHNLRDDIRNELVSYFGDCLAFFAAHAPLFHLSEDRTVVMRTRYYERKHLASLPLEEQLALATQQRDRRRMRSLRRRLALRDTPAHPLHDRDNLARELSRHLPRQGIVPLRSFCKSLPDDVGSFLPPKRGNFFESYPQYFQLFEYQQPGMWYLAPPNQPLPRGVIRQHFTEPELVKMIAAYLQPRESALCSNVMFNLPRGAQETIRRRHGGVYYFMEKYPQFFGIVIESSRGNTANSAQVSLIEVPTEATLAEAMGAESNK